jgi:hypothetical protein
MYRWMLIFHGAWRWLVILAGIAAVANALNGLRRHASWEPLGPRLGRLFGIAVDIEVLTGAVLYLVLSPLTSGEAGELTYAAPGSEKAFFSGRHALTMLAALFAVHIASVLTRRGRGDAAHQRRAALFYGLTLLIVLSAVPWWRPLLRL